MPDKRQYTLSRRPLILLAMVIERLYRLRYLHRGDHGVRSAMDLVTYLWLSLGSRHPPDTG